MRSKTVLTAIVLLSLLAQPAAQAQCATVGGSTTSNFFAIYVDKGLNKVAACELVLSQNVLGCSPATLSDVFKLAAIAKLSATSPVCQWQCDCGSGYRSQLLTIDGSDGLPVELMSFSVDDEE